MGWAWVAVVVWVVLAVPAAVLLARVIHRADRPEPETAGPAPDAPICLPGGTRRPRRAPGQRHPCE